MDKIVLNAQARKILGRKVSALRKEGLLPANIYGKKIKSQAVTVKTLDFLDVYKKAGETALVSLVVKNGKSDEKAVLISNVQKDHVTDEVLHADFHQVDLKEKVSAEIPVEITGEAPAEKQGIGTVVQYLNEIEVEALPTDLPEKFGVDISNLVEVDQAIFVKDLPIEKAKVKLISDPEAILVKVEPPQKEEVVVPPPAEEVPEEGAAPVEGEAPAEGETASAETPKEEIPQ